MNRFSFKNRIAFNYIIYTSVLIFAVFFVIFSTVQYTVIKNVDDEIEEEVVLQLSEIKFKPDTIIWINKEEWEEREHSTFSVNPVFIEIQDFTGKTIEKSPNLKKTSFKVVNSGKSKLFREVELNNQVIRILQQPILYQGTIKGYLLVGMSIEHPIRLLHNLELILFLLYPLILLLLFLIARILAGRSIQPINSIIETSNRITKDNLKYRIELPKNKDEIYSLSNNINSLLDRIENAVNREKQFTSDASHELRTPLAVIKGTLEVLIRKPRNKEEYENKILFCISEVDRLNILVDELLLLARFENYKESISYEPVNLNSLVLEVLSRYSEKIKTQKLDVKPVISGDFTVNTDFNMVWVIVSNLVSNAIKYCGEKGNITINLTKENEATVFKISNSGAGIAPDEIEKIFLPFFRSHTSDISNIKGAGLGLSIVKRICDLLKVEIKIESEINAETSIILIF